MKDSVKTSIYVGVAALLVVLAVFTRPTTSIDSQVYDDTGLPFYPKLADAKDAASIPKALEVVEFDEKLGAQKPFKVQSKDGKWTIPSHHDYPADAEDRLRKTAGAIIGLKKDSIVSDKAEDFAALGVVDPYESNSGSTGWGTRVKLFDKDNNAVSDLIFGKEVEGRSGFRYVRLPGQNRTYAVETKDLDLSIRFADWIDSDLIPAPATDFEQLVIKDYSIDPRLGTLNDKGTTVLDQDSKTSSWVVEGLPETEETNQEKARDVAQSVADLKIVGVRVKPPGLKPDLRVPEGVELALSMQNRGFYLTKAGDLVSNDGEAIVETKDGLVYTLRFGGMILGTGDEVTAGAEDEKAVAGDKKEEAKDGEKKDEKPEESKVQENRFLLLTVTFDESKFPPIPDLPAEAPAEVEKKPEAADPTSAQTEEKGAEKAEEKASDKPEAEAKTEEKPAQNPATEKKEEVQEEKPATEEKKGEEKPAETPETPKNENPKEEKPEEKPAKDAEKDASAKEAEAKAKEEERKRQEAELKAKRDERDRKIKEGKEKAKELSEHYARWYYVVSNDSVKKIRVTRADLIKLKEKAGEGKSDTAPENQSVIPAPPDPGVSAKEPATSKDEAPKEEPPKEAPKEEPAAVEKKEDTPAPQANSESAPKAEEPKAEEPKAESKPEEPKAEEPKAE
ncbi:MAG: DUF4340 domain-containing protein [Planctomycetota bacterium]